MKLGMCRGEDSTAASESREGPGGKGLEASGGDSGAREQSLEDGRGPLSWKPGGAAQGKCLVNILVYILRALSLLWKGGRGPAQ